MRMNGGVSWGKKQRGDSGVTARASRVVRRNSTPSAVSLLSFSARQSVAPHAGGKKFSVRRRPCLRGEFVFQIREARAIRLARRDVQAERDHQARLRGESARGVKR